METPRTDYEIVVEGHLGDRWAREYADLRIARDLCGTTRLTGPMDQAKMHGLFRAFRDGAVTIVSVNCVSRSKEE